MFVYSRYDHTPKRANVNNELDKKLREKIFAFAYRVEPYRTKLSRDRDMDFVFNRFLTLYSSDEKKELSEIFDKLINSTTLKMLITIQKQYLEFDETSCEVMFIIVIYFFLINNQENIFN